MYRLATPVALLGALVIFFAVFAQTGSIVWAPALAAAAGLGIYLLLDRRNIRQVSDDAYEQDASRKVGNVLDLVRDIRRRLDAVRSPAGRDALRQACDTIPELLTRIRATAPTSIYSSASQIETHLTSMSGVLSQYLDIQQKPAFYPDSRALLAGGDQAFARFAEFALDSVRLVNQGNLAQYQANLATVAPPKLPQLGKE